MDEYAPILLLVLGDTVVSSVVAGSSAVDSVEVAVKCSAALVALAQGIHCTGIPVEMHMVLDIPFADDALAVLAP